MKIRSKLLSLILVIIISMTAAVFVYIQFNNLTSDIEKEKETLQSYRNSLENSHLTMFRFLVDSYVIIDQLMIFNKTLDAKVESFTHIKEIKSLPKVSPEIATAIKNISNLEAYQDTALKKFYLSTEDLLKAVRSVIGSDEKYILNSLSSSDGGLSTKEFVKLKFYTEKVKNDITLMDVAMQTSIEIIDKQYALIDEQVDLFQKRGQLISLGIFSLMIVISLIIGQLVSKNIVKSVTNIGDSLSLMSKGDLTHSIIVNSSDEIGVLSNEMEGFQGELSQSLNKIKEYSSTNEAIKNRLIETATETAVATEEISSNISSVDDQINTLNNNILQSNNQVNQISSFTNELNDHVADQMAMVEQSTASITEMIASIASVSNLTQKNMTVVENLQETAKDGDTQITETTDRISDIDESVQNIGAMAEVIQNISEQTNLLAMNAAIEAAHAGDAGKGFAVVADEIRKLSEASAVSSKDIGKNLKDIVKKFEKASISGVKTRDAFSNIYENIQSVSEALLAVSSSTSELNIGGTQILEAMDSLSTISTEVQSKSGEMNQSASMVNESIQEVSQISTIVTQAMAEVNVGFSDVRERITGLESISTQVGDISQNLNVEISKFKTTKDVS